MAFLLLRSRSIARGKIKLLAALCRALYFLEPMLIELGLEISPC
jgi:hypothetical protein